MGSGVIQASKETKISRRNAECMHTIARVQGRPLDSPATQPNLTSPASRPFFHFDGPHHKNRKKGLLTGRRPFPLAHLIGGGGGRRERYRQRGAQTVPPTNHQTHPFLSPKKTTQNPAVRVFLSSKSVGRSRTWAEPRPSFTHFTGLGTARGAAHC